jgi:hypothetical protein
VKLGELGTSVNNRPFITALDENGVFGGVRIGRGNRRIVRKHAIASLYPPQIPHDLTRK